VKYEHVPLVLLAQDANAVFAPSVFLVGSLLRHSTRLALLIDLLACCSISERDGGFVHLAIEFHRDAVTTDAVLLAPPAETARVLLGPVGSGILALVPEVSAKRDPHAISGCVGNVAVRQTVERDVDQVIAVCETELSFT
jgi:hypothetical protein